MTHLLEDARAYLKEATGPIKKRKKKKNKGQYDIMAIKMARRMNHG